MESLRHRAILKKFEFLRQFSKKQNMIKKNYQLNWKVCWQSPAMFCLFTHQAKIQICCRGKLIPWNVVNLSHLYIQLHFPIYQEYCFRKYLNPLWMDWTLNCCCLSSPELCLWTSANLAKPWDQLGPQDAYSFLYSNSRLIT